MRGRVASPDALLRALESVQFVIGRDGQQSGVFLDSAGWETLLDWWRTLRIDRWCRRSCRGCGRAR